MIFKYITLNLWHGGKLWDQIVDFLLSESPDIIAIQEAYNGKDLDFPKNYRTIDELKKVLKLKHSFFSSEVISLTEYGDVPMGNAILSRFPILSTDLVFFDLPFSEKSITDLSRDPGSTPRNIQKALLNLDGIELNVFNTHGIWGEEGSDNQRRLKMSQIIVDVTAGKKNVVLSGDFNVNQGTKSIEKIEQNLKNIFKNELNTSFNMKRKPKKSGFAIAVVDNIFTGPNIKVIEHYCPQVNVSDHLPLVAVLEVS